ncbi:MAG: hypothetical protein LBN05_03270 [Oscillospiraceae bacterium]|nr:hypothetical protein [Oscillospiraceae bacterium]
MDAIAKLPDGDVRPIKGYNEKFRLRVGDWRVVYYQLDEHTIVIERFGARGGIYQGGF